MQNFHIFFYLSFSTTVVVQYRKYKPSIFSKILGGDVDAVRNLSLNLSMSLESSTNSNGTYQSVFYECSAIYIRQFLHRQELIFHIHLLSL